MAYQKQAQQYIDCVLDIDKVGRETQKNAAANPEAFDFQPIPVSFGQVELHACGGVLHPNSIRDIIDFTLVPAEEIPAGLDYALLHRLCADLCQRRQMDANHRRWYHSSAVWMEYYSA